MGTMDEGRWNSIAQTFKEFGYLPLVNIPDDFIYNEEKSNQNSLIFKWIVTIVFALVLLVLIVAYLVKKHNDYMHKLVAKKTKELKFHEEHLEEEVRDRTQKLEFAMRAKSDFLANMSHEIRTPLNAIIGFVDVLYKGEENKEKKKQLKIINESSYSLLTIINDILDFSKIESKKLLIEQNPLLIRDIFSSTVNLFFEKAQERGITLHLDIDENLPLAMLSDTVRIKQVFSNLISNAIKFSQEDSNVDISLKYLQDQERLYCAVKDYGIGIASDKMDDIFNSFVQEDTSTTRKYGGTGLGLSISKALVELMDGTLEIESALGKGSTFYFTLPLIYAEVDVVEEEEEEIKEQLSGTILIVEDNKSNQLLLELLLDELSLDVIIANDGLEAVALMKESANKVNLILMDENMPNMNGMEATKIIKTLKDRKNTPIIAVTANALKGDKEKFISAGMDDYLSKPIDAKKLEMMVKKYL